MKVPLQVSWLQENDLLTKAAILLGYAIVPGSADDKGIKALEPGGRIFALAWEVYFQFTLAQLKELGFEEA
jgi:hypothetical protein